MSDECFEWCTVDHDKETVRVDDHGSRFHWSDPAVATWQPSSNGGLVWSQTDVTVSWAAYTDGASGVTSPIRVCIDLEPESSFNSAELRSLSRWLADMAERVDRS